MSNTAVFNSQGNVAQYARKNLLINGGFDVWQRGTGGTNGNSNIYSADRWIVRAASYTQSADVPTDSTATYSMFVTPDGTAIVNLRYFIENGLVLTRNRTCTLSFWAKADSALNVPIEYNDTSIGDVDLTTSWTKHSITFVASASSALSPNSFIDFENPTGSTIRYALTQVQLELGDTATDFEYRPIGEELALCQRYYQTVSGNHFLWPITTAGVNATAGRGLIPLHSRMRVVPTVTLVEAGQSTNPVIAIPSIDCINIDCTLSSTSALEYVNTITADAEL